MNQRIKEIRNILNLSQREFGEKLGVSRDVISNIEYARVEPKKVFIQLLCTTYNVNEDWLLTGQGEMFFKISPDEQNISEAINIFKALSPELQDYALKQIKGLLELQSTQSPKQ